MGSSGSKSNQKRQRENQNHSGPPQLKIPRLLAKNQPSSEPPSTKITDMNDDCLEKIFMHLDLVSLFNVAVANEWLRPTARIVYKRQYGMQVGIYSEDVSSRTDPYQVNEKIKLTGLKMCLQYLRCFGPSVSTLAIWYEGWTVQQSEYIHQYIENYCAEHLKSVAFMVKPIDVTISQFEKPFANIQKVSVFKGDLGHQLASFPQWFPNLKYLQLNDVRMDNSGIVLPFHHLENLKIDWNYGDLKIDWNHFVAENTNHLLKLCRQLRHFRIFMAGGWGFDMAELLNVIKNNHALRTLIVSVDKIWWNVDRLEMQRLLVNHPTMRALDLPNYKFTADSAIALIRQLGSLRKIRLGMLNVLECDRFVAELNVIGGWQHSSYTDFQNHRLIVLDR